MDGQRFDRLTVSFTTSISRRHLGGVLAALGSGTGIGIAGETTAKRRGKKKAKNCTKGAVRCGRVCVNPRTNALHCGECGRACQGDLTCVDGECGCAGPANVPCGTRCVDTDTDHDHCGECGHDCNDDERCQGGECVPNDICNPPCDPSLVCRGGQCVPECSRDADCVGNPSGNICSTRTGSTVLRCTCPESAPPGTQGYRPCGPGGACSICCSDQECEEIHGPNSRCFAEPRFVGDTGRCGCDTAAGYTRCSSLNTRPSGCYDLQSDARACGSCNSICCDYVAFPEECGASGRTCHQGQCCVGTGSRCVPPGGLGYVPCCRGECNSEVEFPVCP